jgi:hypothetical protein
MVMQRPAKPSMPVRFRPTPPSPRRGPLTSYDVSGQSLRRRQSTTAADATKTDAHITQHQADLPTSTGTETSPRRSRSMPATSGASLPRLWAGSCPRASERAQSRCVGRTDNSASARRTALMNASSFPGSRRPSVRTPVQTSTPHGRTALIAWPTLVEVSPPARKTGRGLRRTNSALTDQSWVRPEPPYSGVGREGRPESSRNVWTYGAYTAIRSRALAFSTWTTWTRRVVGNSFGSCSDSRGFRCETICTAEVPAADTRRAISAAESSEVSRNVATGTAAAIAATASSAIARGEEGSAPLPMSPRMSAPARTASCASSSEAMQQTLMRVRTGAICHPHSCRQRFSTNRLPAFSTRSPAAPSPCSPSHPCRSYPRRRSRARLPGRQSGRYSHRRS